MAERIKAGFLAKTDGTKARATVSTGRYLADVSDLPSVIVLQITITGTASLNVELRDEKSTNFIPIRTVTASSIVRINIPVATVACNITSISSGTVTIHYRTVVVNHIPSSIIDVFTLGKKEPGESKIVDSTVGVSAVDNQKRLYGPAQPGSSTTLLYTVPASKKTTIAFIHAVNTTGSAATLTIAIGTIAAATSLLSAYSIPANGILVLPCEFTLVAAETINGLQGTASAITVTINGSETAV
jgi:hypothetical protein